MSTAFILAMALVLVFEGLLYAFFPDAMKRMMTMALQMPTEQLRMMGFIIASAGVLFTWLIRTYT